MGNIPRLLILNSPREAEPGMSIIWQSGRYNADENDYNRNNGCSRQFFILLLCIVQKQATDFNVPVWHNDSYSLQAKCYQIVISTDNINTADTPKNACCLMLFRITQHISR